MRPGVFSVMTVRKAGTEKTIRVESTERRPSHTGLQSVGAGAVGQTGQENIIPSNSIAVFGDRK